MGGWFKATPEGWQEPFELEVNLHGYIKKVEGRPTRLWSEENQPTMIAKVAESQGLRRIWPAEFQGLVTPEEMKMDVIDLETIPTIQQPRFEPETWNQVSSDDLVADKTDAANAAVITRQVADFLDATAKASRNTVDAVKNRAAQEFEKFWQAFEKWAVQQKSPKEDQSEKAKLGRKPKPKEEPMVETHQEDPEGLSDIFEMAQAVNEKGIITDALGVIYQDFQVSNLESLTAEQRTKAREWLKKMLD